MTLMRRPARVGRASEPCLPMSHRRNDACRPPARIAADPVVWPGSVYAWLCTSATVEGLARGKACWAARQIGELTHPGQRVSAKDPATGRPEPAVSVGQCSAGRWSVGGSNSPPCSGRCQRPHRICQRRRNAMVNDVGGSLDARHSHPGLLSCQPNAASPRVRRQY